MPEVRPVKMAFDVPHLYQFISAQAYIIICAKMKNKNLCKENNVQLAQYFAWLFL